MTDEVADMLRLVAVIIPVGALVTLMVCVKAASACQPTADVRRAVAWIWGAMMGSLALLIVGRTLMGGPMIEVDTLTHSVRVGETGVLNLVLLLTSLAVVVGLWMVAIGNIRRVTAVDGDLPATEEDGDNGVD